MSLLSLALDAVASIIRVRNQRKGKNILGQYHRSILTSNTFILENLSGCTQEQARSIRDKLMEKGVAPIKVMERRGNEYAFETVDGNVGHFKLESDYGIRQLDYKGRLL